MADEVTHGTTRGYSVFGCRCEQCVEAQQKYTRAYRSTESGRAVVRRQAKIQAKLQSACLNWLRENKPKVLEELRAQVRREVEEQHGR